MLKDIKKIILAQKLKSSERVASLENYIHEEQKDLLPGYETISNDEVKNQAEELSNQINAEIMKKRSIFSRLFKKKENSQLLSELMKREISLRKIIIVRDAIEYYRKKIDDEIYFIESEINRAKSIKELGLDYEQAIALLKQNNIEFILDDSDKAIINSGVSFEGLKDFILVHKTRYLPVDGKVRTNKEIGIMNKGFVIDKVGSFNYQESRNTIHFAVNGEVSSHSFGNWDDCKYAILLPFKQLPISQLRSGAVMDTFIDGGITLPKGTIILCPISEIEQAREKNPELNIIGYQGENVTGFANAMVGMLGYKIESVGMWSWANNNDAESYYKILKNEYPEIPTTPHFYTSEKYEETLMNDISIFTSFIGKIIAENIQLTDEDIKKILDSYLHIFPSSGDQIELENLFRKVVIELQKFLIEHGMQISPNVLERLLEIVKDNNTPITDEEKNFYSNASGNLGYVYSSQYADFILKYDILSQVIEKQKETNIQR